MERKKLKFDFKTLIFHYKRVYNVAQQCKMEEYIYLIKTG